MGKAGRKRGKLSKGQPAGSRSASGRLRARDPLRVGPCDGIVRRRAMLGVAADDRETFDALGRAWAAGLLHPDPARAKAMLDAGRRMAAQYWRSYGFLTPDSLARFQPSAASAPANDDDQRRREEALTSSLDAVLKIGRSTRFAFDQLVIDMNPDSGPPFLDRIIFAHRQRQKASETDYALLRRACDGLEVVS